jgi:hypothetical protein
VWTDCQTVKLGLGRPIEWANSSKRKFARIWGVVRAQVDDGPGIVQWMPAHVSECDIGQVKGSDGSCITRDMWCANQMCDLLAKDSAETVRVPEATRSKMIHRRKQLGELLVYLGHLTFAANGLRLHDGSIVRDSTAVKSFRVKRSKVRKGKVLVKPRPASPTKSHWSIGFCRRAAIQCMSRETRKSHASVRALRGVEARKEAEFQHWWRESRSQLLRPRDPGASSATERLKALKQRVAAKGQV